MVRKEMRSLGVAGHVLGVENGVEVELAVEMGKQSAAAPV